jgi:hypothetical protein
LRRKRGKVEGACIAWFILAGLHFRNHQVQPFQAPPFFPVRFR